MSARGQWALLAGLGLILLVQVLARPLLPIDETRYLSVAWEMHLSGDPFHLTRNFDSYSHKPPLLFWLINLVWMVTGVSELAARLLGPVCALVVVWGTGRLASMLWPDDAWIALRAMAVLAGFPVFLIYGGATMFDALLTLPVLLGIWVIWRMGQGERGLWALFGVALAFGVYAKGPVIVVHLAMPLMLMRIWASDPPRLATVLRGLGVALLVALALVSVWLVPALVTGDAAFRHELLWTQTAGRVAGGMAHDRPVWFLAVLVPVLLFPFAWSLRVWSGLRRVGWSDPAARLCCIWGVSGLVLFSVISGKQVHYLVPEFPAMALLIARALGAVDGRRSSLAPVLPLALGLGAVALGLGLIAVPQDMLLLAQPAWALVLFGGACMLLAVLGWRLPVLGGHLAIGAGLAIGVHLLVAGTAIHSAYDARTISARLSAAAPGGLAITGMPYNAEFDFTARLTDPIAVLGSPAEVQAWAASHPQGLLIGPVKQAGLIVEPGEVIAYGNRQIGLWPAATLISRGSGPLD